LEHLWEEKGQFAFGLGSKSFDTQSALLLADPTREDETDQLDIGLTRYELEVLGEDVNFRASMNARNGEQDEKAIFRDPLANSRFAKLKQTNITAYNQLRSALEEIHDDMDEFDEDLKSWPVGIRSLSPTTETQFTPDIMRSVSRLHERLPFSGKDMRYAP
jgi:hypothetical protein